MSSMISYHEKEATGREGKEVLRIRDDVVKETALTGESIHCLACNNLKGSVIFPFCRNCADLYKSKGLFTAINELASQTIKSYGGNYQNYASIAFEALKKSILDNPQLIWLNKIGEVAYSAQKLAEEELYIDIYRDALTVVEENEQLEIKIGRISNKEEKIMLCLELADLVNQHRRKADKFYSYNITFGKAFMSFIRKIAAEVITDITKTRDLEIQAELEESDKIIQFRK